MTLKLKDLRVGKVDGKHEYLTPKDDRQRATFDAFLMPEAVDPDRMHNDDMFFVVGYRGTGKTSFLRWHAEQKRIGGAITDIILFKTDLTETQRQHISNEVGISWIDIDSKSMEIAQDFKDAWFWFILHKIGEILRVSKDFYEDYEGGATAALRLLGLNDDSVFKKAIGFMPKLDGAKVKIKADVKFFEAELGGDFSYHGDTGQVSLNALSNKVVQKLQKITFLRPIFIYFDELETFYHTTEQLRRDQRMVRDLLFAIDKMNDCFRSEKNSVHVLGAVRSEVIGSMGSLGQEVDRLVHDRGFLISWHHANRSLHHPLMQIVKQKIIASEISSGLSPSDDPFRVYFPSTVSGKTVDAFLLDKSFYKPRDIVWRLSIAQKLFPNEEKFSQQVLNDTEIDYSARLWDEVRYELSATYSDSEINIIEALLSGNASYFDLSDIESRFERASRDAQSIKDLIARKPVRDILADLYRLGAIGNAFRAGPSGSDIRNRWSFRGDPMLLVDKRMEIHPALLKRLSAVPPRRRGSQGSRRAT